jgi:DNA-binding transcriptional regulator GbsR (MarR family)
MASITPLQERFVLHWGEMGTRWGINRTVAQIHALLYISPQPMHAEQITATLSVARSNVSNSLRELQGWGLVRVVHVLGDRRDHFETLKDVWEMFRIVLDERKRREIDPTLALLRSSVAESKKDEKQDPYTHERLAEMLDFLEIVSGFYDEMHRLPPRAVRNFLRLKGKLRKWFEAAAGSE